MHQIDAHTDEGTCIQTFTTSEGWNSIRSWGGLVGGIELWTTCFCHLGHILHDWAKCLRLDTHDNVQRARLDTNVHFWQELCAKLVSLHSLLYYCLLYVLTPISYSKQTDNWRIGIEVLMRKRQTEAEMKHWLPIQIAVITISTLKLCNNLYSIALLRWGDKKKKINVYLQCFWINISLWFRIIIFWSHFKKAGDYTLITYCMVGECLRWWWIKVWLLTSKCSYFTEGESCSLSINLASL